MRRRALLASLATVGAGCLGSPDVNTGDPTTTPRSTALGESVSVDGGSVTLAEFRHRHSAITIQADVGNVVTFDAQLAMVTVSTTGDVQPPRSAFSFVHGDEHHDTLLDDGGGTIAYRYYNLPDAYVPGEQSGWVGFEIPSPIDAGSDARIRLQHGDLDRSWRLSSDAIATLGKRAPSFTLESFEVPSSVSSGEDIVMTATVTNGGGPGTFRGSVNTGGILHAAKMFAFDVPPGATVTRDVFTRTARNDGTLHASLVGTDGIETDRKTVTIG